MWGKLWNKVYILWGARSANTSSINMFKLTESKYKFRQLNNQVTSFSFYINRSEWNIYNLNFGGHSHIRWAHYGTRRTQGEGPKCGDTCNVIFERSLTSALGNSFNIGLLWAFSSMMVLSPWYGRKGKLFCPTFLEIYQSKLWIWPTNLLTNLSNYWEVERHLHGSQWCYFSQDLWKWKQKVT